jgi:hypothetical protein
MQRSRFLVLLFSISLFLFTSCKEEFELFEGGDFSLVLNESVILIDGSTLELKEVEDSRCPEGNQCIWEGRAAVTLFWQRNEANIVQLNDVEYITVNVDQFKVTLLSLSPYPTNENAQEEKVARVRIALN